MAVGQIDTSIYREAADANPFQFQNEVLDYRNKLLGATAAEQENEMRAVKLATDRFSMINNAAAGLLSDPDLGRRDITSELWDTLSRLTKGDVMSAQHAVQFLQGFSSDPRLKSVIMIGQRCRKGSPSCSINQQPRSSAKRSRSIRPPPTAPFGIVCTVSRGGGHTFPSARSSF